MTVEEFRKLVASLGPIQPLMAAFISAVIAAMVATIVFIKNRKTVLRSNEIAAAAQLNALFAAWNLELLKNAELRALKTELIWSRYGFSPEQVLKIHFVYYTLNILSMHWNIWKNHRSDREKQTFDETMHDLIGRMNVEDREFFVTNFKNLFLGFDGDFRLKVKESLERGPLDAHRYPVCAAQKATVHTAS